MPKLRIKDLRPRVGDRKKLLWSRLMNLNLLVYSIREPNRNTFLVITSDDIVDKLLTTKTKDSLKRDDFEVITPPEYNAKRTFVLRNIDSLITTIEEEELKTDLENSWLKVTEVIKIPNAPKILKIKAENSEMVRLASERGVLIYNQSIPPQNVEREVFVYLNICYHCYKYDHQTEDCTTPDITVCSECAASNHTYRDCQSNIKKCLNCQEPHRTLAARCPVRKRLIREKGKEMRDRSRSRSRARQNQQQQQQSSYAQVVVGNRNQTTPDQGGLLNREDQVKVQSSIQYAYMVEGVLPGTFHATVKEMYHLNNLPQVRFPDYIPPPTINADNIQAEIQKMKGSYVTSREENKRPQASSREQEDEQTERKRTLDTPSPQMAEKPAKAKRRTREAEEEQELEDMEASAQASSQDRNTNEEEIEFQTLRPSDIEDDPEETGAIPKEKEAKQQRRSKFAKHVTDMKFCFVKTAETVLKRKDIQEITQLLKAGKIKYVYSNPIYKESDCRVLWEKGHVDVDLVDIRDISKEGFNNIHYNGKLIVERRGERKLSTSSQTTNRRK